MLSKSNKLTINDFPRQLPDFKNSKLPKDRLTEKWLTEWIINSLKSNKIKEGDILPRKQVIAEYLGIGTGTVQNAIRYIEDKGYLQSKQKTGTLVASCSGHTDVIKKQTSKRDETVYKIKKYIFDNKITSVMPPAAEVAKEIKISVNTVRLAYLKLCDAGFLKYTAEKSGKKLLKVVKVPCIQEDKPDTAKSLVEKTIEDLSNFITLNLKKGDKLQTRSSLAKIFKVSIKTVHDAVSNLETKGILLSRRGRYGTVVIKMPEEAEIFQPVNERSIFAKAQDAAFYRWEKIGNTLLNMIKTEFESGMKLPSMESLAEKFNVSTNTIRKALKTLSEKGIVEFERGRYGGTFVIDVPENTDNAAYEWLAITRDYTLIKQGN